MWSMFIIKVHLNTGKYLANFFNLKKAGTCAFVRQMHLPIVCSQYVTRLRKLFQWTFKLLVITVNVIYVRQAFHRAIAFTP